MSILNHVAQAAGMLLLLELLVLVLVFLGIAGGLAFGLRWVRGKVGWASGKANGYLALGQRYVHIGTDYAARPVILTTGLAETVKGTAVAVRRRIRELYAQREQQAMLAEQPSVQPVDASTQETVVIPRTP